MLGLQAITEMLEYMQAGRTIIDVSNTAKLAVYIAQRSRRMSRPLRALWRAMAEFMTPEEAKRAIRVGGVPIEWRKEFERAIGKFVRDDLKRIETDIFEEVGNGVARRVNVLPRKEFTFQATHGRVQERIANHGAELLTRSTEAQIAAARIALLEYVVAEALTPFELAKRLRNFIGLTERYADAVLRLERSLIAEGLAKDIIAGQVERYATFLHKVRAENIARTELSFGYNYGQLEAIRQAKEDGWLKGEVRKRWVTTGQAGRVCEECEALDGEQVRESEMFSVGVEAPPLHPSCSCCLSYEARR